MTHFSANGRLFFQKCKRARCSGHPGPLTGRDREAYRNCRRRTFKNMNNVLKKKQKKRDMQVTADLFFRERAMMMILSFLYIVFCKRPKRHSFLNRFYRERAVGISFHIWAFASGREDFSVDTFFRERALIFFQKCKRARCSGHPVF